MPQQFPNRATLRPARRLLRVRAVSTGIAAALAASALPLPGAHPAVAAAGTSTVTAAPVAGATEVAAAAVRQASGALAHAEHITAEAMEAHADEIAEILEATSVVRELVRRASEATPSAGGAGTQQPGSDVADPTGSTADADADADRADTSTPDTNAGTTTDTDTNAGTTTDAAATTDADAETVADAVAETQAAPGPAAETSVVEAADAAVAAVAAAGSADDEQPADERDVVAAALEQQTAALTELIAAAPAGAVAVTPAPSEEEVAAAEAAHLAALAAEAAGYGNGQIPAHLLWELEWAPGAVLRADAAAGLARLNEAFKAHFGRDLAITDSYRSFEDQVAVKRARGRWAATPGTSNHGYGVAVDLGGGIASFGSAEYQWMRANAGEFGWENPEWAQPGGHKPEAWHWEFVAS